IVQVSLEVSLPHVLQRTDAEETLGLAPEADLPPVDLATSDRGADVREAAMLHEVSGELLEVAPLDPDQRHILARLHGPLLEAAQPLARVVREVRLPELAVVDAIDAAVHLLLHHLRYGGP